MTTRACSWLWQVEAVRNGSVVGAERQEFAEHAARCRDCREHADLVESCAQKLKELPSGLPDVFTLRRQRQDLLRRVDQSLTAPGRKRQSAALISIGVAAAAFTLLGLWHWTASAPARWVEITPTSTGPWRETHTGDVDRFILGDGHFGLAVHRPSASSRVVLVLPDGEIEDVGTVLEIWIENGHTKHVAVQTGEVVLRLRGTAAIALRAGQHWMKQAAETVASASERTSPEQVPHLATVPLLLDSSNVVSRRPSSAAKPGAPKTTGAPLPSQEAVSESRPMTVGDEDAAYTRMLKLLEADRRDEAKDAASTYLSTYPHGFRRLEVIDIERRLARSIGQRTRP